MVVLVCKFSIFSKGGIIIFHQKNHRLLLSIVIISIAFGGLYTFRFINNNKVTKDNDKTSVELCTAERKKIESYKKFSGSVKGVKEEAISPQMPTEVKSISVKEGDNVKKDQVLMVLDSSSLDEQLSQTKKAYETAKSQISAASSGISEAKTQLSKLNTQINSKKDDLKSIKNEIEKSTTKLEQLNKDKQNNSISEHEFQQKAKPLNEKISALNQELPKLSMVISQLSVQRDALEKNLSSSSTTNMEGQIEQVKNAYDSTLEAKESFTLKAPFDGYVSSLNAKVGEVPMGLNPPVVVSDISSLCLEIDVLDEDINLINVGSEYTVFISDKNGKSSKTSGKIDSIEPIYDSEPRSHTVKIIIKNTNKLGSGSFAEIQIPYARKDNAVVIPKNALFRRNKSSYVYTLNKNNEVKRLNVTLGMENDDEIEIATGLKPGTKIISKGKNFVSVNEKVNVDRGDK